MYAVYLVNNLLESAVSYFYFCGKEFTGHIYDRLEPSFITLRVGSTSWTEGGQRVHVSKCHIHENYTGSWDYNIALLKLKTPITINNTTTKQIKSLANNPASKSVGKALTVSGWGVRSKVSWLGL